MKKISILLMLMALFGSLAMKAQQTAVLNDGTTTMSYVPFYGLYADYGSKGQFIIPATDLAAKGITSGSQISKLKFFSNATSSGSFFGSSVKVEVGEVSYTTFSSNAFVTSGLTTVLSGTSLSRSSDGTMEVSFSSNYTYNGGNLLISIGGYGSGCPSTSWLGISSTNAGVYGYNSSNSATIPSSASGRTSYAPKTEITYILSTTPYISLNPATATVITGSTETLTATYGNVTGTPSISYSTSNASVATVSGSGTTATVTAVAPGTATITATMTVNGTPYTATCSITVENPSYCTPNPSTRDGQGITALTFGSGNEVVNNSNSSGLPASSPYYGDYTSMVGGYEAGATATVTITYSTGSSTVYSYGTLIWVDWNKNYTFEDSEIVYTGTSAQGSNGTPQVLTATFTVPATQAADDYRMRIAGADSYFDSYIGGSSSANHSPCFSSTYAVCHDYTLRVNAAASCPKPTALNVTNLTPNSAKLNWTGTSDSYTVRYRKAESSVLAEGAFFDDFENGLGNWTLIVNAEGTGWQTFDATQFTGGTNYSGSYVAMARSYEGGVDITADNWMISSMFTSIPNTMTYWAMNDGRDDHLYDETYDVCVSTSSNSTGDFQIVQTFTTTPDTWQQITIDLSAYAGLGGYIAFHHHDAEKDMLLIDDVLIGSIETIPAGEWVELPPTTNDYVELTGLDDDTEYEYQVMANCEEEDSDWTASTNFHTPSVCSVSPTGLIAEVTGNSAALSWTGSADTYDIHYREVDPTAPATLILNVPTDIWNDGTGYQLILDADHSSYGSTIPETGNFTAGTFADFEYTIPENAECNASTNTIVVSGSATITIPAGVYDYVFLNPDPSSGTYYIASPQVFPSRGDDYEFEAGKTYEFTLSIIGSNDAITLTITDNGNAWTLVEGVTNPYTLENLKSTTTYEFQVQGAGCDNWSASASFTTGEFYIKEILGYGNTTNPGGYYLIASPIGQVAPTAVTNMLSNAYDLYAFDQTGGDNNREWRNYKANSFNLEPGQGYLYANSADVDLVFSGSAYQGTTFDVTLTKAASPNFEGWNLVGNPFAETAHITTQEGHTLNFYTLTAAGDEFEAATNTSVERMEGVFVVAQEDGETITFTKGEGAKGSLVALNLSNGRNVIDRAIIRFDECRQLPKFQFNPNHTKVYIQMDGQDYAVVRSEEMGAMPVNFKAESNGTYSLSLSTDNVEFAYLHLIDNLTGNDVDLLQTSSYSFEAKTTDYTSRFKLVFATGSSTGSEAFAYFCNGSFVINNEGNATLQVIDVNGRVIKSESINGCTNVNVNAAPGVYMIRLVNGDNVKVQKVVVK